MPSHRVVLSMKFRFPRLFVSGLVLATASGSLVMAQEATITPREASGMEGGLFLVDWTGPRVPGDQIVVASPAASAASNASSLPASGAGNPARLELPAKAGTYEVRYVTALPQRVLARATITVLPANATLTTPANGFGGMNIEVRWTGPAGPRDVIAVARAGSGIDGSLQMAFPADGNPLKLRLPTAAGQYEVRYILGAADRILARQPIRVQDAKATLKGPAEAATSTRFEVQWEGPDSKEDRIMIGPPGDRRPPPKPIFEVKTSEGRPANLVAPSVAGRYEVLYVTGDDNRILARLPLKVAEAPTRVAGPSRANPGSLIGVEWTGPALPDDQIAIAETSAPPGRSLEAVPVGRGNPAALMMPEKPGTYELRYIGGQGQRILARARIQVGN